MKTIISLLLMSNLLFSQNTPTEVLSNLPPGLYALDIYNDYAYFTKTSFGLHQIGRASLINPNISPEVINGNVFTPYGITVNNDILYFTEWAPRRISKVNLINNLSWNTELLPINLDNDSPWGIKVYDQDLYFSESVMNIKKVPLSNFSMTPQLVSTNIPHQFSFIKEGNFIYSTAFADDLVNNVFKIDLTEPLGTIPENIGEIFEPMSIAKMANLIFVSTNDNKIYKINLNNYGSEPELLYEVTDGESYIGNIKDYNNELYFTFNEFNFESNTFEGKIMKFSQSQLSTNNPSLIENLKVVPNPTSSIINIITNADIKKIDFYDSIGRQIEIAKINNVSFNTTNLPEGTYFITVQFENSLRETIKFVKN